MIDLIILLYLAIVLSVGLAFSWKRDRSTAEYFYGGGRTGPLAFGSSLVLSNALRYLIILIPLAALKSLWLAVVVSLAVVMISYLYRFPNSVSIDLGDVFGNCVRCRVISGVILFLTMMFQIAALLAISQLIISNVLGQDYTMTLLLTVVFAGIYAVIGGGAAVIRTQAFQTCLFLAGLIGLALLGAVPVAADIVPSLEIQNPAGLASAILGLPIVSLWIWHYDRILFQQVHSSKDAVVVHRGLLAAGSIAVFVAVVVFVSPPSSASMPRSLHVYLLLPVCLAAFMAAFATSFSGAAEALSSELFRNLKRTSSEQELVLVGRLMTAAVAGLTIITIPRVEANSIPLLQMFLICQVSLIPPLTAIYVARILSSSRSTSGVLPALLAGETIGILRMVLLLTTSDETPMNPLITWLASVDHFLFAFSLFCFSLIVLYGTAMVIRLHLKGQVALDSSRPSPDGKRVGDVVDVAQRGLLSNSLNQK